MYLNSYSHGEKCWSAGEERGRKSTFWKGPQGPQKAGGGWGGSDLGLEFSCLLSEWQDEVRRKARDGREKARESSNIVHFHTITCFEMPSCSCHDLIVCLFFSHGPLYQRGQHET
jgi:hypothetical protein